MRRAESHGRDAHGHAMLERHESRWQALANVLVLIGEAEDARGAAYTRIFLTRPDISLWRAVDLRRYCDDTFYLNHCFPPYWPSPCLADFHFVLTSPMARRLALLPSQLGNATGERILLTQQVGNASNTEFLRYVLRHVATRWSPDHIVVQRHEEVHRKADGKLAGSPLPFRACYAQSPFASHTSSHTADGNISCAATPSLPRRLSPSPPPSAPLPPPPLPRPRCATAEAIHAGKGDWRAADVQMGTSDPRYHGSCFRHHADLALAIARPSEQHTVNAKHYFEGGNSDGLGWVPAGCDEDQHLDARYLSEQLRGGQLILAGDSLASEQYISLLCMLLGHMAWGRPAGGDGARAAQPAAAASPPARVPHNGRYQGLARDAWWEAAKSAGAGSSDSNAGSSSIGSSDNSNSTLLLPPAAASFVVHSQGMVQYVRSDFLVSADSVARSLHSLSGDGGGTRGGVEAGQAVGQSVPSLLGPSLLGPSLLAQDAASRPGTRPDEAWASRLRRGAASASDTLLLSTGPHWAGKLVNVSEGTARGLFTRAVSAICDHLDASDYRGLVLYRTNYVPGCREDYGGEAPHGWPRLALFDEIWRRVAAARVGQGRKPRVHILNVSLLSSRRIDRHPGSARAASGGAVGPLEPEPDCLHFSLPGPPDVWNWMMQEAMMRHAA